MNIGIDLGTTYSAVSYCKNSCTQMVVNSNGNSTTPSVVLFEDDGSVVVGENAKDRLLIEPEKIVSTVKDSMGTNKKFRKNEKDFSPEEISAIILKKLLMESNEYIGEKIEEVTVTVPAYFTDSQRKATTDACMLAGITNVSIINEPTAAAIWYSREKDCNEQNILVYDLGGGTFDVSIITLLDNQPKVIATGGIRNLGGHFFDQLILNYVVDFVADKYEIDLYDDEYLDILQDIAIKSEECKIKLSSSKEAFIILRFADVKEKLSISREIFENMISKFYRRTESTISMVLNDARKKASDIDKIVLVGGSSRIPFIKENLKNYFGKEPLCDINPDEAVARGAAIYANNNKLVVQDVCSHSIGVIVLDENGYEKNQIIIKRNSSLPTKNEKTFFVPPGNIDTISLEITEGEDSDVEYVNIFSSIDIDIPSSVGAGTSVSIQLELDQNQILHINAKIYSEPVIVKRIKIDRKNNMTEEEIVVKKSVLSTIKVQ